MSRATQRRPLLTFPTVALVALVSFVGCASKTATDAQEPVVAIPTACLPVAEVQATQTMQVIDEAGHPLYAARLGTYRGQCQYSEDNELTVTIVIPVIFSVETGFQGDVMFGNIFVGVIDSQEKILAKSILPVEGKTTTSRTQTAVTTQVSVIDFGLVDPATFVKTNAIILGFQLTPEQLAANRDKLGSGLLADKFVTTQIDPVFPNRLPIRITGPDGSML